MSSDYSITISPETPDLLDLWVTRLNDVKGLIKLHIVREFGDEGTHPHLHCTMIFDSLVTLQTLFPRLKKVFGFIPKKPLIKVKPLRTLIDNENWMNYIHSEEGSILEESWGYLPGEVEALVSSGQSNDIDNNHSKSLSYAYLEKQIDWEKIQSREELFSKIYELKRKGFDCTNIATNPRKLALWFNFTKNAFNPKLNWYADHTYKIFNPD